MACNSKTAGRRVNLGLMDTSNTYNTRKIQDKFENFWLSDLWEDVRFEIFTPIKSYMLTNTEKIVKISILKNNKRSFVRTIEKIVQAKREV